jgi:hypothetical protein
VPTPFTFPGSHKSLYGHRRGPSELSGDRERSELDSRPKSLANGEGGKKTKRRSIYQPVANARSAQGIADSPVICPMPEGYEGTDVGVGSPVSPPTQRHDFNSQRPTGTIRRENREAQNWMVPQAWNSPTYGHGEDDSVRIGEGRDDDARGLGVLDFLDGDRERLDDQRADRRQASKARPYHGAF